MARPRPAVLYRLLVIALALPVISALLHFKEQPADVTVREGAAIAAITCHVADLDPALAVVSFERDDHIISDGLNVRRPILSDLGLDPESYKVSLNIHAGTGSRRYSLSIHAPSRNDTGSFRCVVCRKDSSSGNCNANHILTSTEEIGLMVTYPPADSYPLCTVEASSPSTFSLPAPNSSYLTVDEGDAAVFACSSETASPPVRITWTRDGAEVGEGASVDVADEAGMRVSRLHLTPAKKDNGTVLSCSVTSDAYNETSWSCSLPPLLVTPRGTGDDKDDPSSGQGASTGLIITTILAVVIIFLVIAIAVAYCIKRKREDQESPGHKIEYHPAETADIDHDLT